MRYFKYKNVKENKKNAYKEHYLSLTKDEQRTVRKEKFWRRISTIVSFIIFFLCMGLGIYLLTLISKPSGGWKVLYYAGVVLLGIALLPASGILAIVISSPLWKKADKFNLPAMKKEILSKACAHLREYYQVHEPYILTKCYQSTNENFTNHDVCIFVVGDELRITTDLIKGFIYGERDLGCYAFTKEEISLSKKQGEKFLIAQLTTKNVTFLLGYRAKSFIEKFLNGKSL